MPGTCVIGLQWGDEAKGKLVDLLTEQHDLVVRYQGGANAGHTVVGGGQTYKLSLIPSGILTPGVLCVVTGGVVVHPKSLLAEIDQLVARGVEVSRESGGQRSGPCDFSLARGGRSGRGATLSSGEAIGTTQRGIGPCYRDKVGRTLAIRLGDMYRDSFAARIEQVVAAKNRSLAGLNGQVDRELPLEPPPCWRNIANIPSG